MNSRRNAGALVVMSAIVGGQAANWLITPHPGASDLRAVAVGLQLVMGVTLFLWAVLRYRAQRESR